MALPKPEAGSPALTTPDVPAEDGLIGRAGAQSFKVLQTDDTTQPLGAEHRCATGESGYVWLNTPALMKGYFRRDDLTAKAVRDGWFMTGDIGLHRRSQGGFFCAAASATKSTRAA